MRVLDHVVQQHFGFFHAYRRGHLTDKGMVARFLEESCELAGLEAVREDGVPNPVVSTAHKFGLGGLMHITTSAIDWMGWHKPGDCEYFTVLWYTCGARPDWDALTGHACEFFGAYDWDFATFLHELAGLPEPDSAGLAAV